MSERIEELELTAITVDTGLQPRAGGIDAAHVQELSESLDRGEELPELVVYRDVDGTNWLSDGFHRLEAHARRGARSVVCRVRAGSRADALENACRVNARHPLKFTNADKRRAVRLLLAAFPRWSDRKIADTASVGNKLVGDVRREVCSEHTCPVREGRDGKAYPARAEPGSDIGPEEPEVGPGASGDASDPESVRRYLSSVFGPTPPALAERLRAHEPLSGHVFDGSGRGYVLMAFPDGKNALRGGLRYWFVGVCSPSSDELYSMIPAVHEAAVHRRLRYCLNQFTPGEPALELPDRWEGGLEWPWVSDVHPFTDGETVRNHIY